MDEVVVKEIPINNRELVGLRVCVRMLCAYVRILVMCVCILLGCACMPYACARTVVPRNPKSFFVCFSLFSLYMF